MDSVSTGMVSLDHVAMLVYRIPPMGVRKDKWPFLILDLAWRKSRVICFFLCSNRWVTGWEGGGVGRGGSHRRLKFIEEQWGWRWEFRIFWQYFPCESL